jgi:hypothetical protein
MMTPANAAPAKRARTKCRNALWRDCRAGAYSIQPSEVQMKSRAQKLMIALCIAAGLSGSASAQSTSNWQTLTDHQQLCAAKSPPGWEQSIFGGPLILAGGAKSNVPSAPTPIGIARITPQVNAFGKSQFYTYDQVKSLARSTMKITQVIEDTPTRFWIEFDGKTGIMSDQERGYRVHWYVVVPSNPVCAINLFFSDPAVTERAKLIAKSLKGAK